MRNFAPKTVAMQMDYVARFARHFGKSPELLGEEHVRQYMVHLVEERKMAWGTYNQALSALRYLYLCVLAPWRLPPSPPRSSRRKNIATLTGCRRLLPPHRQQRDQHEKARK